MSTNGVSGYLPAVKGYSTTAIHAGQDSEQWDSWQVNRYSET